MGYHVNLAMSANDAASTANARSTSHCEFGVAMCFSHRGDARDPLPWVRVHLSLSCWPGENSLHCRAHRISRSYCTRRHASRGMNRRVEHDTLRRRSEMHVVAVILKRSVHCTSITAVSKLELSNPILQTPSSA
ncbi:hypothetical protein L916_10371 [Phytophthora nicotianae]|uniref:Uncharacterized protein n=1 Tax=Phytophthora nicotianae TaxID=4792 RepID=W2IV56_PHYNI|nr:hypothetical protein L916_10371 [Phytophthora nicotianae]